MGEGAQVMADRVEATGASPNSTQDSTRGTRFERLSKALRDNLRKRKQQARDREAGAGDTDGDDPTVVPTESHLTDFEA